MQVKIRSLLIKGQARWDPLPTDSRTLPPRPRDLRPGKAVSAIGRGENAGRTLIEFNIVRDIHSLGRWDGQKQQYHARVDALPRDATDVAVLVQTVGQAPIIGAATLALR